MSISAEGHHQVALLAQKGSTGVAYTVRGGASSRRLDADFGALGRVHIRFRLKPEPFSPSLFRGKSCRFARLLFFGGRFHGEVEFAGEPEVAGVNARSGRVDLVRYRKRACKHEHRREGSARPQSSGKQNDEALREVDFFSAEAQPEGRSVSLNLIRAAESGTGSPATLYIASLTETAARVRIVRSAVGNTRSEVLRLGKRGAEPTTATIELPAPFSGSASYAAEPGAPPSWSGDLAVALPGAVAVPLTGIGFNAGLCRSFSSGDPGVCTGSLAGRSPEEVGEFGR
ncbi:MAG TPA: hypothetical protein VFN18_00055 [Solirubrobacterales bacterium]|nr:hypothetical protein [Solirubrobacterales bacterium]